MVNVFPYDGRSTLQSRSAWIMTVLFFISMNSKEPLQCLLAFPRTSIRQTTGSFRNKIEFSSFVCSASGFTPTLCFLRVCFLPSPSDILLLDISFYVFECTRIAPDGLKIMPKTTSAAISPYGLSVPPIVKAATRRHIKRVAWQFLLGPIHL